MGRFAQERFQQSWRFAQELSEKLLIEGGMDIRGARHGCPFLFSMSDFSDYSCAKRPNLPFLREAPMNFPLMREAPNKLTVLARSAPMVFYSENSGSSS